MKVLMVLSSMAMGGAERNIASVVPHLARQPGLDFTLGTLNTRRDSPLADLIAKSGVRRFDMGAKRMVDPAAWKRFTAFLRDEQIDLIHSQDQDTHVYSGLAHYRLGMPVVMTRHVMFEPADSFKTQLRARMVLLAARLSADRVIAVSEAVRRRFAEQTGLPLTKIETIYNGIELEKFNTRGKRAAKRAELGWEADRPIAVMVAVLRPGKGHEVLFEAVPALKAAVPGVQIKLVGDGELRPSLEQMAAPHADVVEFMGQRMDVPELLGAADALILPSWSEALPTVLIEAGAAGLPCVATDVGGTAEIVIDGETGYVIPTGNPAVLTEKLAVLLNDREKAAAMGAAAYRRVTSIFTLEQQAARTADLYARVLAEKRGTPRKAN